MNVQLTFRPDGTVEHIGDETAPAAALLAGSVATSTKRRASHVEPCNVLLRLAFHAVRFLDWFAAFVEEPLAAEQPLTKWTRSWPCLWRVRVVGGPTFGPYRDRAQAIADEVAWLEVNRL